MAPDFRKLQYFVALFEEGSVSRAAERLNIVQSALSMQLKQLEADLGIRLFDRSAQGVRPAPAARHFYALCLALLRQYDGVLQEMRDFNQQVAGVVRLGLMPSICRGPFALILQRYLAAYPEVEVRCLNPPAVRWRICCFPMTLIWPSAMLRRQSRGLWPSRYFLTRSCWYRD